MVSYDRNVAVAMETIKKYRYSPSNILLNENCYSRLKIHFLSRGITPFDLRVALDWCTSICKRDRARYRLAILRLGDVYENGRVLSSHLAVYGNLSQEFSSLVDKYISSLSAHNYSATYLDTIEERCSLFFRYAEINGFSSMAEINFSLLEQYHQFIVEADGSYRDYEFALIPLFKYWAERGIGQIGFGLFFRYAKFEKYTTMQDISQKNREIIETQREESMAFPPMEFYEAISGFLERMRESGYSASKIRSTEYHLSTLCMFLDREGLGYDRVIADVWVSDAAKRLFGATQVLSVIRTLDLFDDYCNDGDINPSYVQRHCKSTFDSIPDWCKTVLNQYRDLKTKEGLNPNTVKNYIKYCSKFCLFLHENGLHSFEELTPEIIKQFNLQDEHNSSAGKNTFNSGIRFFLIYLEIQKVVPFGLHYALPYCDMGGEKIVKILSPDDKAKIETYCENAKTPIELRDAAILRIGMDTALRASDIVSLRKTNIDWKNKFIQFDQSKTSKEHLHPVENRTLNAILRYRRDGINRKGSTDFIFLSTQAPYHPISPVACNDAMRRAGCSVTDFHRIRRTYATDTLKSGATIKETAELLGQTDTSTVHKYVVLDEERMRLCPLSLSDTGLVLKGRYTHD